MKYLFVSLLLLAGCQPRSEVVLHVEGPAGRRVTIERIENKPDRDGYVIEVEPTDKPK